MIDGERILASRLLDRASDSYSCHGCNDTDEELLTGISEEDKKRMLAGIKYWNGDADEDERPFRHIGDFEWMAYLAHIIGRT